MKSRRGPLRAKTRKHSPKLLITDTNDQRLGVDIKSPRLVMLFFFRWTCPHAVNTLKNLKEITSRISGNLKLVRADIDSCLSSSAYNKVVATPTTLFIRDSKVVGRIQGEITQSDLLRHINRLAPRASSD